MFIYGIIWYEIIEIIVISLLSGLSLYGRIFMHELGHYLMIKLLYDYCNPQINIHLFSQEMPSCDFGFTNHSRLSFSGQILGYNRSHAIISAAGPIMDTIMSIILLSFRDSSNESFYLINLMYEVITLPYCVSSLFIKEFYITNYYSNDAHDYLNVRMYLGFFPGLFFIILKFLSHSYFIMIYLKLIF